MHLQVPGVGRARDQIASIASGACCARRGGATGGRVAGGRARRRSVAGAMVRWMVADGGGKSGRSGQGKIGVGVGVKSWRALHVHAPPRWSARPIGVTFCRQVSKAACTCAAAMALLHAALAHSHTPHDSGAPLARPYPESQAWPYATPAFLRPRDALTPPQAVAPFNPRPLLQSLYVAPLSCRRVAAARDPD